MPTLRPVSFDYFNEWRISNYLLSLFTLPQFVYDLLCLSCPDLIICVVFPFTNCVPLTSVCQTFWRSLEPSGRPKKKEPSTFSTSYSVEPLRPWEVRTHRHMHSQTSTLSVQIDFFLVFFFNHMFLYCLCSGAAPGRCRSVSLLVWGFNSCSRSEWRWELHSDHGLHEHHGFYTRGVHM